MSRRVSLADWNYIAGEDNITQDFNIIDKGTGKQAVLPDVDTADMTILNSDLSSTTPPITNVAMSVVTTDPLVLRYLLDDTGLKVPQTAGMYLAIIRLNDSTNSIVIKTFELDLRVFIGG